MLIVMEGCDGVGKTHLAEVLKEELNRRDLPVTMMHRGVPELPVDEEYNLDWYSPGTNLHAVLDRWHLGDWVYGRLYQNGSMLGLRGVKQVDRRLIRAGALRLVVDAELDVVRTRLIEKGEDYLQPEHIAQVISEYRMLCTYLGWIPITSNADPAVLVDWAISLEEEATVAW